MSHGPVTSTSGPGGNIVAFAAFAGLIALALIGDFLSIGTVSPNGQPGAWRLLGTSVAGGAITFAILAMIVRNPDGTVIARNPNIIRENRLRNRRWTGGVGFGILLSLGLVLGAIRGSFLVVAVGAFTGFLFGLLGIVVYAQLITRPQR